MSREDLKRIVSQVDARRAHLPVITLSAWEAAYCCLSRLIEDLGVIQAAIRQPFPPIDPPESTEEARRWLSDERERPGHAIPKWVETFRLALAYFRMPFCAELDPETDAGARIALGLELDGESGESNRPRWIARQEGWKGTGSAEAMLQRAFFCCYLPELAKSFVPATLQGRTWSNVAQLVNQDPERYELPKQLTLGGLRAEVSCRQLIIQDVLYQTVMRLLNIRGVLLQRELTYFSAHSGQNVTAYFAWPEPPGKAEEPFGAPGHWGGGPEAVTASWELEARGDRADLNEGYSAASKPAAKRPSDNALQAWRLRDLLGLKTQQAIAEVMGKELGRTVYQGEVSRWLRDAAEYLEAGGVFPPMAGLSSGPVSIDPHAIDVGERQDRRTRRQRARRKESD